MKKTAAFVTASVLLASVLLSCGAETGSVSEKNTDAGTPGTESAVQDAGPRSGVPDDCDLGGEHIKIWYTTTGVNYTELNPEQNGEVLEDAVFDLNLSVRERLNVNVDFYNSGIGQGVCNEEISKLLLSDDTEYQAFFATQWSAIKLVAEGLYLDIADAPYLSLDKEWWDSFYMKEMSIGRDRMFTLVGDYAIDRTRFLSCCFYNKRMYADYYGEGDGMYQKVLDGEWTFDMLEQVGKDVFQDLNNNGKTDRADVLAVISTWNEDMTNLQYSTGMRITERDENDIPYIVLNNERTVNIIERLYRLLKKSEGILYDGGDAIQQWSDNSMKFSEGTSMYLLGHFYTAEYLREMKEDYGIIPLPKFDASQERYNSCMQEIMRFMALPYNCQKTDAVCAVLEEMAFQGHNAVVPVYYDTVLKTKYARDDISGQMIDMIHDNLVTDIALIFNTSWGSLSLLARTMFQQNSDKFASNYAKAEKQALADQQHVIDQFMSID